MSKGNAVKGDRATHSMANPAFHASDCEDETYVYHKDPNGLATSTLSYFTGDISNPPTRVELDSIVGTPASVGVGYVAIVADNSGSTNEYIVWSNGSSWFYILAGSVIESSTSDSSSAYAQGSDSDVDSIPAYVLGSEDTNDSTQSFTQGLDNTSDSTTAYTEGVSE